MESASQRDVSPTFRQLLADLGQDLTALVHDELDLVTTQARTELRSGLLMLGVLTLLSLAGVLTLCAAAVLGLARVLDPALAALAVGAVLTLLAAVFAATARGRRKERT
ncbi:MAG TPA: phage holin family protein [Candidatus Binatia bacterium]|nr:phage holin family protein [Candidatus Binatia bacterium]